MRRISIALVLLISCISSITAAYVGVNPSVGGFNIDMASWDYQGGTNWSGAEVSGAGSANSYSYEQMVGIGGVYEMEVPIEWYKYERPNWNHVYLWDQADSNNKMTISASCPNGFYFVSASNPSARRPFNLIIALKTHHQKSSGLVGGSANGGSANIVLGQGGAINSKEIGYWDYNSSRPHNYGSTNLLIEQDDSYRYQYMWFDVILELPIDDITNTGLLTADGRVYNLVEADDYSAIVTLSIDWNGQHTEVTIPMSGHYSINDGRQSMASLVVRPRAAASNLDIKNMAGDPQTVADIDFMSEIYYEDYERNRHGISNPTAPSGDYRIFLSASNDPLSPDSTFLLEHSSRSPLDAPSPYNTIEYTATLRGYDGPLSDSNRRYLTETFYGNEAISGANVPGVLVESGSHSNTGGDIQYAQFTGSIDVTISEPDTPIMQQGRYVDEIYIHVISTGG